jgi:hypothetical protein
MVLERSLEKWKGSPVRSTLQENPSVSEFEKFWTKNSGSGFRILYVAGHQSTEGELSLNNGQTLVLSNAHVPKLPPSRGGLVLWDTCYADSARLFLPLQSLRLPVVWASTANEKTWEVDFHRRKPVDLTGRYPREAAWLKQNMPKNWDGRISFLGLVWLRTFLETPTAPQNAGEWKAFADRLAVQSREFPALQESALASTITVLETAMGKPTE